MMVANWGEMHPQKVVGLQPLPHTWPPEYDIFYTKICTFYDINMMVASLAGPIRVRILPRGYTDPYWASSTSQYFLVLASRASQYFLLLASRGLCHGSFKSSLGNTRCLEGNIATVIFQYSIVR